MHSAAIWLLIKHPTGLACVIPLPVHADALDHLLVASQVEAERPQAHLPGSPEAVGLTARDPEGSVRFRANRVKTVFSSIHDPPFLLTMRGVEGVTANPKKLVGPLGRVGSTPPVVRSALYSLLDLQ